MANIAIINYCNLKCPYCFANEFIEENKQVITIEQLDNILNWLGREHVNKVGLIGGEPTIHPDFVNVFTKTRDFVESHDSRVCVFSNGILLGDYARLFNSDKTGVLINLNHPDIVGYSNWNQIEMTLKRFKAVGNKTTSIGINLYPDMTDFSYIIETAKKFGYKFVRCSYVAPTCNYKGLDKEEYYNNAKSLFLDFVKACAKDDITVRLDCNHIPLCYFTEDEKLLLSNVTNYSSLCNPVVDITPDMHGTACFGAYDLVDLNKFENIKEAENYFLFKKIYPKRLANNAGKCSNCSKFDNLSCQGGCLAFTNV